MFTGFRPRAKECSSAFVKRLRGDAKLCKLFPNADVRMAVLKAQFCLHRFPGSRLPLWDREVPLLVDRPSRFVHLSSLCDSGRLCKIDAYEHPIVHDLATMQFPPSVPLRYEHGGGSPIGFVTAFRIRASHGDMLAYGFLTHERLITRSIVETSKNRDMSVSLACGATELEYIPRAQHMIINRHRINGPAFVARFAIVREMSITSTPADHRTYALIEGSRDHRLFADKGLTYNELLTARIELERAALRDAERDARRAVGVERDRQELLALRIESQAALANIETRDRIDRETARYRALIPRDRKSLPHTGFFM